MSSARPVAPLTVLVCDDDAMIRETLRRGREIGACSPATRIMAFSAHGDAASIREMRTAGAAEYLVKGVPNGEIVAAVRRLGRGVAGAADQASCAR